MKYTYTNANPCHITLTVGNEAKDFSLFQGEEYELPEENASVKRMVSQGLLRESGTSTIPKLNKFKPN